MGISITFTGETAEEIQLHCFQLAQVMKPIASPHTGKEDSQNVSESVKASTLQKRKAKKAKDEDSKEVEVQAPVGPNPFATVAPSEPDVEVSSSPSGSPSASELTAKTTPSASVQSMRADVMGLFQKIAEKYGSDPDSKGLMLCKAILDRFGGKPLRMTDDVHIPDILSLAKTTLELGQV